MTCESVSETVGQHGRTRRITEEQCATRLLTGTVKFTSGGNEVAALSRSGVIYATGSSNGHGVLLQARRAVRAGRYILTERHGHVVTRQSVTVR